MLLLHFIILVFQDLDLLRQVTYVVVRLLDTAIYQLNQIVNLIDLHFLQRNSLADPPLRTRKTFGLHLLSHTFDISLLMLGNISIIFHEILRVD